MEGSESLEGGAVAKDVCCRAHSKPLRGPHLDGLDGVLHLEQPAFGAERVDATIILAASEEHRRERVPLLGADGLKDWKLHTLVDARNGASRRCQRGKDPLPTAKG